MAQIDIVTCPKCGKLIVTRFPLHDCKPTKNFLANKKEKEKKEKKNAKTR